MVNAINSDRFHVENWLTYGSTPINTSFKLEPEQQIAMVDAVLQLFTTLLGVRTYLGKKLICQDIYQSNGNISFSNQRIWYKNKKKI